MKKTLSALCLILGLMVAFEGIAQDDKPSTSKAKKEMNEADASAKKAAKAEKKAAKDAVSDADATTKAQVKADKKAAKDAGKAAAKSTTDDVDPIKQKAIDDRMAAARSAKAAKAVAKGDVTAGTATADATMKKSAKMTANSGLKDDKMPKSSRMDNSDKTARTSMSAVKEEKATPADYKAPVDQSKKGPNGEKVMTGPRGGKYYINKNGNKTYLSSVRD